MPTVTDGLVGAFVLDGAGGGRLLDWSGVRAWKPDQGVLWIHLDYAAPDSQRWLAEHSGLDPIVREALLTSDPRPRSVVGDDGLLIILRTVNLNLGARAEDMVSVRIWIDQHRIVSMRHREIEAVRALRHALETGRGPVGPGDLLVDLGNVMLDHIAAVVDNLDDDVDRLEDAVLSAESYEMRHRLADFRRKAIALRRHIAPQREVMARLQHEKVSWLHDIDRQRIRETSDRLLRLIEELDAARERASVTSEELSSRLAELMNRRLYTLSIVAAIFLPLGFVTGLLGVNVGGIPGSAFRWSFILLCVALVAMLGLQLWLFRRLRWI